MADPDLHPPAAEPRIDRRVHLALVTVQLIFAGFHVVGKAVLAEIHPFALAGLRVTVAAPLLALLAWRHDRVLPSLKDLPALALLALTGVFANQLLFIVGLSYTTAANAAILMPSIPVFAVAVGALFGIERIGRRRLAGILAAVAGAVVVVGPAGFTLADRAALGNLLVLANCLSYAVFLVFQRPVLERLPWRTVIAWSFLLGAPAMLAVTAPRLAELPSVGLPAATWLGVAYVVFLPTIVGYSLNTWAVRRSSASLAAVYTTLQPLLAALLAVLFLAEQVGARQIAGFALIALGLWRVSARRGTSQSADTSASAASSSSGDGR